MFRFPGHGLHGPSTWHFDLQLSRFHKEVMGAISAGQAENHAVENEWWWKMFDILLVGTGICPHPTEQSSLTEQVTNSKEHPAEALNPKESILHAMRTFASNVSYYQPVYFEHPKPQMGGTQSFIKPLAVVESKSAGKQFQFQDRMQENTNWRSCSPESFYTVTCTTLPSYRRFMLGFWMMTQLKSRVAAAGSFEGVLLNVRP